MEKLIIRGGCTLSGTVEISGAQNSAIAMIPAALLADSPTVLEHVPNIRDVRKWIRLLQEFGADVSFSGSKLRIDPNKWINRPLLGEQVMQLRASYYLMGVLLTKFGEVTMPLPGGFQYGPRPLDQHMKGLQALGAIIRQTEQEVHLSAKRLQGAEIYLDVTSVGATIHIMLAAVLAKGTTIIHNAAKEPEVIDVATMLGSMGANIKGAGTDHIRIYGVDRLKGCSHTLIPDRIEAGTYMIAAAATGGQVQIEQVIPKHLDPISAKLREIGVRIEEDEEKIIVTGTDPYHPVDVKAFPYPGFPTDLQPLIASLLTQANGTSLVTDSIFSSRYHHVSHLVQMGAKIIVEGRTAIIQGKTVLRGREVTAVDLRSASSLLIAGLMAKEMTILMGAHHLERGYERLEQKLKQLGADIRSM